MGSMFTASRIVFSAARRGFLPEFLSGIHKDSKTPVAAIITLVKLVKLPMDEKCHFNLLYTKLNDTNSVFCIRQA